MPHCHRGGRTNRSFGHHAFTLIEVLIVIAIIAILFTVLIPNLFNARNAAQECALQAHSRTVQTTVAAWTDNRRCPHFRACRGHLGPVFGAAVGGRLLARRCTGGHYDGSVNVGAAEAIVVTVSGTVRGEVVN